jgi:hypothetical protein
MTKKRRQLTPETSFPRIYLISSFREETRNRTNEETNHMKLQLEARFSKHHGELE